MRGRSALVSRDDAPVLTPPGAASGPSAAPSSAPGARAPAPRAGRLSGFKLSKRRVDYTAVDQPTPAVKKRKEEAVALLGTSLPAPAASPSMEKGGVGAHVSPARSSSRDLGDNPREELGPVAPLAPEAPVSGSAAEVSKAQEPPVSQAMSTIPSPPPPAAPLIPGPSTSPDVLECALSQMTRLREDLQGADPRLVAGRLELVSGWLHSDVSVRAALSQATATSEKEKQVAAQAAAAQEARSRKAEEENIKAREDAIKGRDAELEQSAKAQATEHGRLEELAQKVKAEEAELDAKARVLAEERAAFTLLEERSCVALKTLSVKGKVEALLKKFRAFAPAPSTDGATSPAAPADGIGEGDATKEGAPLAGAGGVQG
nr:translation initiation factor IF-2-like [Aegilops tauschii subsp. strangulata]